MGSRVPAIPPRSDQCTGRVGQAKKLANHRDPACLSGWYTNFLVRLLGGGLGAQGSAGLQMDPRITAKPDLDIEKSKSDAFGEQELSAFLKTHQLDHLILTGLDGNACVKNTSIGALNRGYRVELCDPAILAYNQKAWELQKEALQEMGAAVSHDIVENAADAGAEKDPA